MDTQEAEMVDYFGLHISLTKVVNSSDVNRGELVLSQAQQVRENINQWANYHLFLSSQSTADIKKWNCNISIDAIEQAASLHMHSRLFLNIGKASFGHGKINSGDVLTINFDTDGNVAVVKETIATAPHPPVPAPAPARARAAACKKAAVVCKTETVAANNTTPKLRRNRKRVKDFDYEYDEDIHGDEENKDENTPMKWPATKRPRTKAPTVPIIAVPPTAAAAPTTALIAPKLGHLEAKDQSASGKGPEKSPLISRQGCELNEIKSFRSTHRRRKPVHSPRKDSTPPQTDFPTVEVPQDKKSSAEKAKGKKEATDEMEIDYNDPECPYLKDGTQHATFCKKYYDRTAFLESIGIPIVNGGRFGIGNAKPPHLEKMEVYADVDTIVSKLLDRGAKAKEMEIDSIFHDDEEVAHALLGLKNVRSSSAEAAAACPQSGEQESEDGLEPTGIEDLFMLAECASDLFHEHLHGNNLLKGIRSRKVPARYQ